MSLAHSPRIVTDGLVLAIDAGNTKSYPGTGTLCTDMSRSKFNGTINGGVSYSAGTFVLDTAGEYIDFGPNVVTSTFTGLTVEIILKTTTQATELIMENGSGHQANSFYLAKENSNFITFEVADTLSYGVRYCSEYYPINQWLHITGTWTSGGMPDVYINGELKNGTTGGSARTTLRNGDSNLQLGQRPGGTFGFKGAIAVTRVYNKGLSESEVRTNFNATRGRFGL